MRLLYIIPADPQPKWANAEKTMVDVRVIFPHIDMEARYYTAAQSDPGWEHSEEIFARVAAGEFGPIATAQPPNLPVKTKLFKAEVWRRCTDSEAALLDAALNSQPVRLRRMWDDATFISSTDELYNTLKAGITAIIGAKRAGELLEPTE